MYKINARQMQTIICFYAVVLGGVYSNAEQPGQQQQKKEPKKCVRLLTNQNRLFLF